MDQSIAVITGDFIDSTRAGQPKVDAAMGVLQSIAEDQAARTGTDIRFARYRGDGWQIYSEAADQVFRLAMLILANLQARPELPATRMAIAAGGGNPIPAGGIAAASGEAFVYSGTALDAMRRGTTLVVVGPAIDPSRHALFSYLAWQSERWTPEQAEALVLACSHHPPRPKEVYEVLEITRQAAEARLKGAGYHPIHDALVAFETMEH